MESLFESVRGIWRENRLRVCKAISEPDAETAVKGVFILVRGNSTTFRNSDVENKFRQQSNFFWLSGIDIPDSFVLIDCAQEKGCTVFVPEPESSHGIWHGRIRTNAQLQVDYDVDNILHKSDLGSHIASLIQKGILTQLWLENEQEKVALEEFIGDDLTRGENSLDVDVDNLISVLQECRNIKSEKELLLISHACKVSSEAHIRTMKLCRPGVFEYQLESCFIHNCMNHGLYLQGYPSIIGAGYNSAVLHYSKNSSMVRDGDLVLIDAGGEILNYTADITRTFPANGVFTEKQRLIYSIVLSIQKELIGMIRVGIHFRDIAQRCSWRICEAALKLGLLKGSESDIPDMIKAKVQYTFMPHGLGHYLGQDVHDTTIHPGELEHGNVITIEPGFYFNESAVQASMAEHERARFINFEAIKPWIDSGFGGVRIEDDVLVLAHPDNYKVLTSDCPKEIEEIEELMKQR